MKKFYLGLDQGTTGTTVMIFDEDWNKVSRGYKEHTQYYPQGTYPVLSGTGLGGA